MTVRSFLIGLLAVGASFWGCSDSATALDENANQAATTSPQGKADLASAAERLGPAPEFDGLYELKLDSSIIINHTESGETSELNSGITGIAQLERDGESVTIRFSPCRITLPKIDGNAFSIPNETVEGMEPLIIDAKLVAGETSYQLSTEQAAFVAGAKLDAPISDSLPQDEDDVRVHDTEGDDYPGVTVLVRGSYKIFSVVRVVFELNASLNSEDVWSGGADLTLDLAVLGDKIPLTNAKRVINEQLEVIEISKQDNTVALTPIDSAQATCTQLYGD